MVQFETVETVYRKYLEMLRSSSSFDQDRAVYWANQYLIILAISKGKEEFERSILAKTDAASRERKLILNRDINYYLGWAAFYGQKEVMDLFESMGAHDLQFALTRAVQGKQKEVYESLVERIIEGVRNFTEFHALISPAMVDAMNDEMATQFLFSKLEGVLDQEIKEHIDQGLFSEWLNHCDDLAYEGVIKEYIDKNWVRFGGHVQAAHDAQKRENDAQALREARLKHFI